MPKKKKGKRRAKSSDKVPALGGASPEPAAERGQMREAAQARAALEQIRAAAQAHKTEMAAAGSASDGSFVGSGPGGSSIPMLAPDLPDQIDSEARQRDREAGRAHLGAEARQRLRSKASGEDTSVTNRMRMMVRANNETNAAAYAAGSTPDLPGLSELVDSMRGFHMQMIQTMGAKASSHKTSKKLMDLTCRRNKAAHTDLLSKVARCARAVRVPERSGEWSIIKGQVSNGAEIDEYRCYRSKAASPNFSGAPAHFGLVLVVQDDDTQRMKSARLAKVVPILSIMQTAKYTENMLVFMAMEAVSKVEMASMLIDRLIAKETEMRVDMATAASVHLRDMLAAVEDGLEAFADSPLAKNAAQNAPGQNVFDLVGPIENNAAMVYEALEVLSTALTQISRDAGAAYNDARAAAADVVEKPGGR